VLRRLRFFHDFSHAEIREVMRAAAWWNARPASRCCAPADTDDRFYVVVSGRVQVSRGRRHGRPRRAGRLLGEAAFAEGARRDTAITADGPVMLLKVTATLLEQTSIACQLRLQQGVPEGVDRAACSEEEGDRDRGQG